MVTQAMGLYLATPRQWRFVLFISSAISVGQFCLSPFIVESPSYLGAKSFVEDQKSAARRLWGDTESLSGKQTRFCFLHLILYTAVVSARSGDDPSLQDPLLSDPEEQLEATPRVAAISLPQLLKAQELRRPLLIVSFAMLSQQLSGMLTPFVYYIIVLILPSRNQCW
jgi:hypothetical protein